MAIKCCKDCTKRHPRCHDACNQYQTEKAKYNEEQAEIRRRKEEDRMFSMVRNESIRLTRRRQHRL